MNDNRVEELMKRHPPWFMFDTHPMRFAKKLSEGEQEEERNRVRKRQEVAQALQSSSVASLDCEFCCCSFLSSILGALLHLYPRHDGNLVLQSLG